MFSWRSPADVADGRSLDGVSGVRSFTFPLDPSMFLISQTWAQVVGVLLVGFGDFIRTGGGGERRH